MRLKTFHVIIKDISFEREKKFPFNSYIEYTDLAILIIVIVPPALRLGDVMRRFRLAGIKHLFKDDIDSSITLDLYVRELNILTNLDYLNYC